MNVHPMAQAVFGLDEREDQSQSSQASSQARPSRDQLSQAQSSWNQSSLAQSSDSVKNSFPGLKDKIDRALWRELEQESNHAKQSSESYLDEHKLQSILKAKLDMMDFSENQGNLSNEPKGDGKSGEEGDGKSDEEDDGKSEEEDDGKSGEEEDGKSGEEGLCDQVRPDYVSMLPTKRGGFNVHPLTEVVFGVVNVSNDNDDSSHEDQDHEVKGSTCSEEQPRTLEDSVGQSSDRKLQSFLEAKLNLMKGPSQLDVICGSSELDSKKGPDAVLSSHHLKSNNAEQNQFATNWIECGGMNIQPLADAVFMSASENDNNVVSSNDVEGIGGSPRDRTESTLQSGEDEGVYTRKSTHFAPNWMKSRAERPEKKETDGPWRDEKYVQSFLKFQLDQMNRVEKPSSSTKDRGGENAINSQRQTDSEASLSRFSSSRKNNVGESSHGSEPPHGSESAHVEDVQGGTEERSTCDIEANENVETCEGKMPGLQTTPFALGAGETKPMHEDLQEVPKYPNAITRKTHGSNTRDAASISVTVENYGTNANSSASVSNGKKESHEMTPGSQEATSPIPYTEGNNSLNPMRNENGLDAAPQGLEGGTRWWIYDAAEDFKAPSGDEGRACSWGDAFFETRQAVAEYVSAAGGSRKQQPEGEVEAQMTPGRDNLNSVNRAKTSGEKVSHVMDIHGPRHRQELLSGDRPKEDGNRDLSPFRHNIPKKGYCHDAFFACLYLTHLFTMVVLAVIYGKSIFEVDGSKEDGMQLYLTFQGVMWVFLACSAFATIMSGHAILFVMRFPAGTIQGALMVNVTISLAFTMMAFVDQKIWLAVVGVLFYIWSMWLVRAGRQKMKFATRIFKVARSVLGCHPGLFIVAFSALLLILLWSICWGLVAVGLISIDAKCEDGVCKSRINFRLVFLLVISYFWTYQVIKNMLLVTTASATGHWWSTPVHKRHCGVVRLSLLRTFNFAFGSICIGGLTLSLFAALARAAHFVKKRGHEYLVCMADFVLDFARGLVQYFHEWAYVYVGLYDMGFIEAGKNVLTLFERVGWSIFLTDNLIANMLSLLSIGVGALTGLLALILTALFSDRWFPDMSGNTGPITLFFVGFVVGFMICQVSTIVVSAAVNTSVICYFEAPHWLAQNQPRRSERLGEAWSLSVSEGGYVLQKDTPF